MEMSVCVLHCYNVRTQSNSTIFVFYIIQHKFQRGGQLTKQSLNNIIILHKTLQLSTRAQVGVHVPLYRKQHPSKTLQTFFIKKIYLFPRAFSAGVNTPDKAAKYSKNHVGVFCHITHDEMEIWKFFSVIARSVCFLVMNLKPLLCHKMLQHIWSILAAQRPGFIHPHFECKNPVGKRL